MGGVFPGAGDIPAFWHNVLNKVNSITEVPRERWDWKVYYDPDPRAPDKTYCKIGGFVSLDSLEPSTPRIPAHLIRKMDNAQKFALAAAAEALRDSGYDRRDFNRERTAVIIGHALGGDRWEAAGLCVYAPLYERSLSASPAFARLPADIRKTIASEMIADLKSSLPRWEIQHLPGQLSTALAGWIAHAFDLRGANFAVDAACASSLAALDCAVKGLRMGEFDMALCGGVECRLSPVVFAAYSKMGALSPDGSRPFDGGANGLVLGEGAGLCVLKRHRDAVKDGDRVYAVIRAVGSSSDGYNRSILAPSPRGQLLAMRRAFEQLDYSPGDVGLLEGHGTSTPIGDFVELMVSAEVFSPHARPKSIGLGSVKSQVGHLQSSSGAAGLIKAALALHHGTLPPSINVQTPNPQMDWDSAPFFIVTDPMDWPNLSRPRRAHLNAFGFGGINYHLALEEVPQ